MIEPWYEGVLLKSVPILANSQYLRQEMMMNIFNKSNSCLGAISNG